ncbi:MAG: zinc metallopeptidase [Ruminiclostridium sp.]|nr:zinc metallopeptidase [Ruminiclostridium sp.]
MVLLASRSRAIFDLIFDVFAGKYYSFVLIGMILFALFCQFKVKSTFGKYNLVTPQSRLRGNEVARMILDMNGLYNVQVVHNEGALTDHYNDRTKTVYLSDSTYNINSISAIGVAAHECGHAIQYARNYGPIKVRNTLAPAVQFCSGAWFWVLAVGLFLQFMPVIEVGIIFYMFVVVFQLVTLPVEFNASKRAMNTLYANEILVGTELDGAKQVLSAAAMTYVASFLLSLIQLIRLLLRFSRKR